MSAQFDIGAEVAAANRAIGIAEPRRLASPGVYPGVRMIDYLTAPAVSASIIRDAATLCPRAAWYNSHLNPKRIVEVSDRAQSTGTIAHSILLEGNSDCVRVIDPAQYPAEKTGAIPDGWTNKAIRQARDEAIIAGKIPVLVSQMAEIEAMVGQAREFIESLKRSEPAIYAAFQPDGGDSELTILWDDAGTLCRIRTDRISTDRRVVVDYKTGGTTAEPGTWGRTQMVRMGYYVNAAFYRRGIKATFGEDPIYVYLVQEQEAPYLCSLVGIDPAGIDAGDRTVARGLRTWKECERKGEWPAYPTRVCYADFPAFELARVEEAEMGHGIPYDPAKLWGKEEMAR